MKVDIIGLIKHPIERTIGKHGRTDLEYCLENIDNLVEYSHYGDQQSDLNRCLIEIVEDLYWRVVELEENSRVV